MIACKRCGGTGWEGDGAVLRQLRLGFGMGLREMARALGRGHTYLQLIETGKRAVTTGHLETLYKDYASAGMAWRSPP